MLRIADADWRSRGYAAGRHTMTVPCPPAICREDGSSVVQLKATTGAARGRHAVSAGLAELT